MLQNIQVLHQSSKSTVTLVLDTDTGRRLVRKELSGCHEVYEKLQSLQHPFLPELLQVEVTPDKTCILEEYIEGAPLAKITLSERALTRALLELCKVLEFLHGHGILHRDIKPDNILLAFDGHIRLIDFDAAREPKEEKNQDTRLLGTRGYAPPEQYGFSQTDARADFYALGATFRQLLGPVARKGKWKRILRKCTALDPKDRYASAGQIRRAIYRGRVVRWGIRPVCLLLAAMMAALIVSVFLNPSARVALLSVFGAADTEVWEKDEIDLDALRQAVEDGTAPLMYEYSGQEALDAYDLLKAQYPDLLIVYSGYMDTEGALVFGCMETTFAIRHGAYTFDGLHSIVRVTKDGTVEKLEIDRYDQYAPAVIALYEVIQQLPQKE